MNELDWIAEEITDIEERLAARRELTPYAAALLRALQRTFTEACKASRALRYEQAAKLKRAQAPVKSRGAKATSLPGARAA